jgi:hypothetical protein
MSEARRTRLRAGTITMGMYTQIENARPATDQIHELTSTRGCVPTNFSKYLQLKPHKEIVQVET